MCVCVLKGPGGGGGDLQGGNHRHQDDGTQTHHGRPAQQVRHTSWGALQYLVASDKFNKILKDVLMFEICKMW